MFVRVSRKFEHGLLFSYESRIIGGARGGRSDRSADVLESNSKLKC